MRLPSSLSCLCFALAVAFLSLAGARPAHAQCEVDAAQFTFTNGRPHVNQSSNRYGTTNCPGYTLVDVTYKALSPLPGTYLSWGEAEPTTSATCTASKLTVKVWDKTTSTPVYKGEVSSVGSWVVNPDPVANPGTHVCYIPSIRLETSFGLTPGRKYRFGTRALRTNQKGDRPLIFANAAAPSPAVSNCGSVGGGFYCALPTSSGATSTTRWPTKSVRLRLESPSLKVAQGGDLFFQDGEFFHPSKTYSVPTAANYGYSNTGFINKGAVAGVDAFTCEDFRMIEDVNATPRYTYLDQAGSQPAFTGNGFCVLNARNNSIYRVFVDKSTPDLLVVAYRWDRSTNRAAWGCLDGLCDADVRVASQFMKYTTYERDTFVGRQRDLLRLSRGCIEGAFQRRLPVPLSMTLHGERMLPTPTDATTYGLGGKAVVVVGFQGLWKAGNTRILDSRDIRFELHESTHAYNANLFVGELPSWLNEGLSIQANRLTCGDSPDYLRDFWRSWTPGSTSGHAVGSELFKRLETEYACDVTCTYGVWRALIDALGTDPAVTNAKIKTVMEATLGRSLTPLFTLLGIAL